MTRPPSKDDWIICVLAHERELLTAWYPDARLLPADLPALRGLSLAGRAFITDQAAARLSRDGVQDHVALSALVRDGDPRVYPLAPPEPVDVEMQRNNDTGVCTVLKAGPMIRVAASLVDHPYLEHDARQVVLRLDTAGEYRYRFAYAESEDVWVYTRITPSQTGHDQH